MSLLSPSGRKIGYGAGENEDTEPAAFEGVRTQVRCVEALFVREMMKRFGRGNLGFLWVLLEPMILTIGVMIMWRLLKGEREHGLQIAALVLTGYMPLTLWRHMTGVGVFAIRSSSSLLYHRKISLFDVVWAKMLLEFAGTTAALCVVLSAVLAMGVISPIYDFGLVLLGWLMMAGLALGAGLVICMLTESSEVWEKFIQPYQYLILPISGCFFMVDWLPPFAQDLIWFNPTVHCYEAFRAGVLGPDHPTHFSPWYTLVWALGLLFLGLRGVDRVRHHVHLD